MFYFFYYLGLIIFSKTKLKRQI